jgi:hypothetical protein
MARASADCGLPAPGSRTRAVRCFADGSGRVELADNAQPVTPYAARMDKTMAAVMLAGMCTFLNVYPTQPLLPYFRQLFHASELEVSLTVSATIFAVAVTAPFVGVVAERRGRKTVIVPSLLLLTLPTALCATANSLHALTFWRFMQGLFVPGVIAVMLAYITEEWEGRGVGRAMAAYVSGTVMGGFLGRFLAGLITTHWNWRAAFVALAGLNLAGALLVRAWLPMATRFVKAEHMSHALADARRHLRNLRLLANFGTGAAVLFSLVGCFIYCEFLPGGAAVSSERGAIGQHLLRLPGGRGDHADVGKVSRPLRLPAHRLSLLRDDDRRTAADAGAVADGGDRRAGAFFVGSVHRTGGGDGGNRGDCRAGAIVGRGTIRNVLLPGRQHGRGGHGMVLAMGAMAWMRGAAGGSRRRQSGAGVVKQQAGREAASGRGGDRGGLRRVLSSVTALASEVYRTFEVAPQSRAKCTDYFPTFAFSCTLVEP